MCFNVLGTKSQLLDLSPAAPKPQLVRFFLVTQISCKIVLTVVWVRHIETKARNSFHRLKVHVRCERCEVVSNGTDESRAVACQLSLLHTATKQQVRSDILLIREHDDDLSY